MHEAVLETNIAFGYSVKRRTMPFSSPSSLVSHHRARQGSEMTVFVLSLGNVFQQRSTSKIQDNAL